MIDYRKITEEITGCRPMAVNTVRRKDSAMNIEDKKTALDDDSLLYQKRDDSLGKKDTSNLTRKQKVQYFKDYYLKALLVVIAVLILAGALIYNMFFRHQVDVLHIAFINGAYVSDTDTMQNDLRDYYELTSKDEYISLDYYNLDDYTAQMKLSTFLGARVIDLMVCDEESFAQYSALGCFADLSEILPADVYAQYKDQIVMGHEEETDENFNVIKTYPDKPYGIDITDNAVYRQYGGSEKKSILGIVASTERLENVMKFFTYISDTP